MLVNDDEDEMVINQMDLVVHVKTEVVVEENNRMDYVGGEKSIPLLKGCGDNKEGGVDNVSLVFDFDVFVVNEDKNDGVNDGDDKDFEGDGV